jgi:hypothetical protein
VHRNHPKSATARGSVGACWGTPPSPLGRCNAGPLAVVLIREDCGSGCVPDQVGRLAAGRPRLGGAPRRAVSARLPYGVAPRVNAPGKAERPQPCQAGGVHHFDQGGWSAWLHHRVCVMARTTGKRNAECSAWAICSDLSLMGWTARNPCGSSCPTLPANMPRSGAARTIDRASADPALLVTADGSSPWPAKGCGGGAGSTTC